MHCILKVAKNYDQSLNLPIYATVSSHDSVWQGVYLVSPRNKCKPREGLKGHISRSIIKYSYTVCSMSIKATTGVCEAHLHQAYKPYVIGAIPSQTYGNVWWWSP